MHVHNAPGHTHAYARLSLPLRLPLLPCPSSRMCAPSHMRFAQVGEQRGPADSLSLSIRSILSPSVYLSFPAVIISGIQAFIGSESPLAAWPHVCQAKSPALRLRSRLRPPLCVRALRALRIATEAGGRGG